MAFCIYHRFKILAVETIRALVIDEGIAANYSAILHPNERGAGTAPRPKPNAVITFSQGKPLRFGATLAEYSVQTFKA
ncbi:hypothetical protein [Bradyrhizobium sp. URHC0002]